MISFTRRGIRLTAVRLRCLRPAIPLCVCGECGNSGRPASDGLAAPSRRLALHRSELIRSSGTENASIFMIPSCFRTAYRMHLVQVWDHLPRRRYRLQSDPRSTAGGRNVQHEFSRSIIILCRGRSCWTLLRAWLHARPQLLPFPAQRKNAPPWRSWTGTASGRRSRNNCIKYEGPLALSAALYSSVISLTVGFP